MPKHRLPVLLLVLAGVIGLAAIQWARRPPPQAPVIPANLATLDPQLQTHLRLLIERVTRTPRDPRTHAVLGLAYMANGLWTEARASFLNVTRLEPEDPHAWIYAAVALQETGQPEAGLQELKLARDRFPGFPPAHYRFGDAALRAGHLEQARAAFERLTQLATNEWRGYAALGDIALRADRPQQAVPWLEKAVQLDPEAKPARTLLGAAYAKLGRPEAAAREQRLGLDALHDPMPDTWAIEAGKHARLLPDQFELAREWTAAGQPHLAVRLLEEALRYHPDNLNVLDNLALAHQHADNIPRARTLLERALELRPDYLPAHVSLTAILLALNDPSAAEAHARKALEISPQAPEAHLALANVLLAREQDAPAAEMLEKAAQLDPKNLSLRVELADLYQQNLQQPDQAIRHLRVVLESDPFFAPALFRMSELLAQQGQRAEAISLADRLQKLFPGNPDVQALQTRLRSPDASPRPEQP